MAKFGKIIWILLLGLLSVAWSILKPVCWIVEGIADLAAEYPVVAIIIFLCLGGGTYFGVRSYCKTETPLQKINKISFSFEKIGINKNQHIEELKNSPLEKRVAVPYHNRKRFIVLTDEDCKKLDTKMCQEIEKLNICYTDKQHQKRVDEIINKMKNVLPETFSGKYYLIDTKEVNALCLPYGTICITKGLLEECNQNQLAFIIGHEYAHFLARHSAEGISKAMIAESVGKRSEKIFVSKDPAEKSPAVVIRNAVIKLGYYGGVYFGVSLPNSRKCEYEADRIGLLLGHKAGYNMRNALNFFAQYFEEEKDSSSLLWLLSTHPQSKSRWENGYRELAKLDSVTVTDINTAAWNFKSETAKEIAKVKLIEMYLKKRAGKKGGKTAVKDNAGVEANKGAGSAAGNKGDDANKGAEAAVDNRGDDTKKGGEVTADNKGIDTKKGGEAKNPKVLNLKDKAKDWSGKVKDWWKNRKLKKEQQKTAEAEKLPEAA